ncbi:aspartic peptidase domain-containing protein [Phycomyces nitens]|nr:aspartic peptidase domain-containing protein [Phycomyces nitens]
MRSLTFAIGLVISCLAHGATSVPIRTEPSVIRFPLRRLKNYSQASHHLTRRQADLDAILDGLSDTNDLVSHSAPLLNDLDICELGIDIEIGSPPKKYLLLFDTGSSDTWIPSHDCTPTQGCHSKNGYNPAESSTYNPTSFPLNITYGKGSAVGKYFVDQMSVGDLTVPKQLIAYVDSNEGPIATQNASDGYTMDGLFGAGYPGGSIMYQNFGKTFYPFPMSLWHDKLIPEPVFSVYVGNGNKTEWSGEVIFGGTDLSKTSGKMVYTNVIPYSGTDVSGSIYTRWRAGIQGFTFKNSTNQAKVSFTSAQSFTIDTGSNFIYLPQHQAELLAKHVDPKATLKGGHYVVDCSYLTSSDVFSVYFPAEYDPANPDSKASVFISVLISDIVGRSNNECILFVLPSKNYIIGNLFLRKFVTLFDFGKNRIGFAPAITNSSN